VILSLKNLNQTKSMTVDHVPDSTDSTWRNVDYTPTGEPFIGQMRVNSTKVVRYDKS
jgi:hypothetical protein